MRIRIVSLNLWQGGNLFPAILEFLKSQDADVVLLQEVYNGQDGGLDEKYRSFEVLRQLGYQYSDFAEAYLDDRSEGLIPQGNAVLSKFEIKDSSSRFLVEPTKQSYTETPDNFPILPRVLQGASLDCGQVEINVFNFHGVWDIDGDNDSAERRKMVEIIIKETSSKHNVVLAGDTNAKPTNPAMSALSKNLLSVFSHELKTTFNMRRKTDGGYATAAVDMMFISQNLNVINKSCPDVDISDHLPLVVELQIA